MRPLDLSASHQEQLQLQVHYHNYCRESSSIVYNITIVPCMVHCEQCCMGMKKVWRQKYYLHESTIHITQLQVSAWRIAPILKDKKLKYAHTKLLGLNLVRDPPHVIELLVLCHFVLCQFVVIFLSIALY